MSEFSFDHLWNLQEVFYLDRPLMKLANQDVLTLLSRLEEEAKECREAICACVAKTSVEDCVDLLNDDIRQEVSDLFLFVMGIARTIGLTNAEFITDAVDKIARNMCRYNASDFKDSSLGFSDQIDKSRSWDKRRGFTTSYYQFLQ